jgi:hypothetical protein
MKSMWLSTTLAAVTLTAILPACNQKQTVETKEPVKPVTLIHLSAHSDPVYQTRFIDNPVLKKQFPNLTLERMLPKDLNERMTAGVSPDVVELRGSNSGFSMKKNELQIFTESAGKLLETG